MGTQVLANARIHSLNPKSPHTKTLVIQDEHIIAVGDEKEISPNTFSNARRINLNGHVVLPAFTDAHIHLLSYGLSLKRINCETSTKAECIQQVIEIIDKTPPGNWVLGHGWNHNIWPDGSPSKKDLDAISNVHPVYLTHKSLHSAWLNSCALVIAGISRDTPDPVGGKIGRMPDGAPDGILYESARQMVEKVIPVPDETTRLEAISAAQIALNKLGISSVHDFDGWDCYETLSKMESDKQLKLKVVKSIPYPYLNQAIESGLKSGDGDNLLSIGWLKLFADGALGPQTAAMLSPYENSGSTGMLLLDAKELVEIGQKTLRAGISLAVHAIGDLANREVLDGYAQLFKNNLLQLPKLNPRIEHVQLIHPMDSARLAQMGITASMQPIHAVSDRDIADRHWGTRCETAYAWKMIRESNENLVFGSDAPVESPNPFWGLFAAVSRSSLGNEPTRSSWTPEQRISLKEAFESYTYRPQTLGRPGRKSGRLQAGFYADLIILPLDPFNLPSEKLPSFLPKATMINGEWVYFDF
jgi:predicted amidohydrolase YtcJ